MEHVIEVRARYQECDPMGVVHHTVYPVWFEMGRTELLRSLGGSYREMEAEGVLLAVISLEVRYHAPARYDDLLSLRTTLSGGSRVKLEHAYELSLDGRKLVTGRTVLACLDGDGRPRPLPDALVPAD
ncbi:MAG: thioesterase family protein [Phycisphaerales bacterium]|nr:thioesterase family protein [Phycisphaerales bacterium]